MTAVRRRSLDGRFRSPRCWKAVLDALDLPAPDSWALGRDPHAPEFCALVRTAYRTRRVATPGDRWTVGAFTAAHPTGTYLVAQTDHVMALLDGCLVDTFGGTGRRRVLFADQLTAR